MALGKNKTAGALAERWLGWAQKGQRQRSYFFYLFSFYH